MSATRGESGIHVKFPFPLAPDSEPYRRMEYGNHGVYAHDLDR